MRTFFTAATQLRAGKTIFKIQKINMKDMLET